MIATLESVTLFDQAEALASMITQSECYINYMKLRKLVSTRTQSQKLIQDFLLIKEKYDEVQRFGRYHPDYKKVIRQMMDAKRAIDMDSAISDYKQAEKELENLLHAVSQELAGSVSSSIMVPTGDPFFDRSCSTGCGGGGSCKCHVK
ncbi:MAG: YlbF family regulator [Sporolactobacillus sp.]